MRPIPVRRGLADRLLPEPGGRSTELELRDGSHVAVIGAGPAGSLFSYFLLRMASSVGLDVRVDLFESRDFTCCGPRGCNHCGGVVSESLVQLLATEGINLPSTIVQRGIDSYTLHMDVGSIHIETPLHEKRIAALFRGAGPGCLSEPLHGLDDYLQRNAVALGAKVIADRVKSIEWESGRPRLETRGHVSGEYDLCVMATGVNSSTVKLVESVNPRFRPPQTTKTYICEFVLGEDSIREYFGTSMHVFLLNIPRLEFAALIPKGECLTLCLLGESIDKELVGSFLESPEVRRVLPVEAQQKRKPDCNCSPKINTRGAIRPFADRIVLIGDCGVSRLYKDGIGAAYRTAKAAANTAVFYGVGAVHFRRHYWKACRHLETDNRIGKAVFASTRVLQKARFARRAVHRMLVGEQSGDGRSRRMSTVIWDLFTGSAPYREVLLRTMHPLFWSRLAWNMAAGTARGRTGTLPDVETDEIRQRRKDLPGR